ncbi:MAG: hypothetical protein HY393_01655 [Candidatus Diapherotrites archaeon]|nr:hypothetical protein [Candidatus Diapherotrites archaeon]
MTQHNVYWEHALEKVPHLLTLLDTNPHSPTFGCFDKRYWHRKTRDYVNARMQEGVYTLALLYTVQHPENKWFSAPFVKEWALAGMNFWARIQGRKGGFDEYLPNEDNYDATAFSSYAIARAHELLECRDESVLNALENAGKFLHAHEEPFVANHEAGAGAALQWISIATKKEKYAEWAKKKIENLLINQQAEGWFSEYNGFDVGYHTFSLYYLNAYYVAAQHAWTEEALKKAFSFFAYFVHPDCSVGGHYGSRETYFVLPTPFEQWAQKSALNGALAHALRRGLETGALAGPLSFDDRYCADALYPFLECAQLHPVEKKASLPFQGNDFDEYFEGAGMLVSRHGKYYTIVNARNGGIGKHFIGEKLAWNDTGWVFEQNGTLYCTHGPSIGFNPVKKNEAVVRGHFYGKKSVLPSPSTLAGLRALNAIGLGSHTKKMVRNKLILDQKPSAFEFERRIAFTEHGTEVQDSFGKNVPVEKLALTANFSTLYSTSLGLWHSNATPIPPPHVEWKGNSACMRVQG